MCNINNNPSPVRSTGHPLPRGEEGPERVLEVEEYVIDSGSTGIEVSISNLTAIISQKIRLPAEIRKFRLPRPSRQAIVAGGQIIQKSSGYDSGILISFRYPSSFFMVFHPEGDQPLVGAQTKFSDLQLDMRFEIDTKKRLIHAPREERSGLFSCPFAVFDNTPRGVL